MLPPHLIGRMDEERTHARAFARMVTHTVPGIRESPARFQGRSLRTFLALPREAAERGAFQPYTATDTFSFETKYSHKD